MVRSRKALVGIALIGIFLMISSARANPVVVPDPSEIEIPYCETRDIAICIENFTGLYAFEFKIWWLKDVVNYTGYEWKPYPPEWPSPLPAGPAFGENETHKSVAFGISAFMGDPFNYSGRWAFIDTYWHCLEPGVDSPLIFDRDFTKLYDEGGLPIPIEKIIDGLIINQPPPVGGTWIPVDKFALLAPYIVLASTILAATSAAAIYIKRRKEKR